MRFFFTSILISATSFIYAQESNVIPGNIIAMVNSKDAAVTLASRLQYINGVKTGISVDHVLSESMHIYLFNFDASHVNQNQMLAMIKHSSLVKIAQFNHTFTERITPNDPNFSNEWDMHNTGQNGGTTDADIDAPQAWDITTGGLTSQGDTIVVAVIDGGFDLTQQDLGFWKNYHEIPNNGIDDDGNGYIDDVKGWNAGSNNGNITSAQHGTHVSGTIGAKGNNGIGIAGVNWKVKIMPLIHGSVNEANIVVAYSYAMDNRRLYNQTNGAKGAFIVATNSSFGIDLAQPSDYPIWCAMYDSLGAVGILSAGATANANYNVDVQGDIPTACESDWLITVTNTTNTDAKNANAGYGATTIDIGAPGTSIWSSIPGNTVTALSGTSMATPHVAGAIALMYSVNCAEFITNYKANPAAIALMVKDSLLGAVDLLPSLSAGRTLTGGRLNLFKSVKSIQNYCSRVSVDDNGQINSDFEITNVYPNPATKTLNVVYNSYENVEISITNVLGQEVVHVKRDLTSKGVQHNYIDITSIEKGIYFVSIHSKNKKSNVVKVVVY